MPDLEDDLQATSDALLSDVDQLRRLEEEKRLLDVRDPRVAQLSSRIEELGRRAHLKSAAEKDIADELQDEARRSGTA